MNLAFQGWQVRPELRAQMLIASTPITHLLVEMLPLAPLEPLPFVMFICTLVRWGFTHSDLSLLMKQWPKKW